MAESEGAVVVVVGGGAAGTLTAARLLRDATRPLHVVLFDPRGPGHGVAYSTVEPSHRLNVREGDMSADAADPGHFARWRGPQEDPFARRGDFGGYLEDALAEACRAAAPLATLYVRTERVVAVGNEPDGGLSVWPDGAPPVLASRVVLALGNRPPGPIPGLPNELAGVIGDPWAPGALEALDGTTGRILLVGSGLTMVDVALALARRAPAAPLLALSRTGLVPRAHRATARPRPAPLVSPRAGLRLEQIADAFEGAVAERPWREVVDSFRPVTQGLWAVLPEEDQRAFLDAHARRWSVMRHRMAPSVAAQLDALRGDGRLEVRAGRVLGARPATPAGVEVDLLPMPVPTEPPERLHVAAIVNCTGPQTDLCEIDDALVRQLLADGHAEAHPLGLGLRTDAGGRLLGPRACGRIRTLGCLRQGDLYESTAIPEIRTQAAGLARALLEEI